MVALSVMLDIAPMVELPVMLDIASTVELPVMLDIAPVVALPVMLDIAPIVELPVIKNMPLIFLTYTLPCFFMLNLFAYFCFIALSTLICPFCFSY
jgi:hypothetical protein